MSAPSNMSLGGYTCPNCHTWAPSGSVHSGCSTSYPLPQPTPVPVQTTDQRIAAALERIASALERAHPWKDADAE